MSYFIRNSNTYRIAAEESLDIQTHLPVGNYTVKFNDMVVSSSWRWLTLLNH